MSKFQWDISSLSGNYSIIRLGQNASSTNGIHTDACQIHLSQLLSEWKCVLTCYDVDTSVKSDNLLVSVKVCTHNAMCTHFEMWHTQSSKKSPECANDVEADVDWVWKRDLSSIFLKLLGLLIRRCSIVDRVSMDGSNLPAFALGWMPHPISAQLRPNCHPLSQCSCSSC